MTMPIRGTSVDYPSRRITVPLPGSFTSARTRYEELVPPVDTISQTGATSWDEVVEIAKANAPHGFMLYNRIDLTPTMALSGAAWQATQYLMGNHTFAEQMYRHDAAVMLYAPLRTLLHSGPRGTSFTVDQPSLLFASFGDPRISAVGEYLDTKLAALITLLGGQPPQLLGGATAP